MLIASIDGVMYSLASTEDSMTKASRWVIILGLGVALLFSSAFVGATAVEPDPQAGEENVLAEWRLSSMAERLRMAMTLATLAVLSPTPATQRLHIQQVINLLEGVGGKHFVRRVAPEEEVPGLLPDARALSARLVKASLNQKVREPALVVAKHTLSFLNLALETSLLGLRQRRLERAANDMLKTYAYLSAALGCESDPTNLGGVLALSRLLIPSPPVEDTNEQP